MPPIIAIQFSPSGKHYHFDAQGHSQFVPGDRVVVSTSRGKQLGVVVTYVDMDGDKGRVYKPIEGPATSRDLVMQQQWNAKALTALVSCRKSAEDLGLQGYKFIKAEYNFDGSQVTIYYNTEKKRDSLSNLRRALKRSLRTQVELYQVGPRDFAKMVDGLGACGVPRCCSRFLTKFRSVSIRMAKLQQISLTPSEITGMCGRLRCCLAYENQQYAEAAEGLPRRGREVLTPYGQGKVVEVRTLAGSIVVDVGGVRHKVLREDIGKDTFTTPPAPEPSPLDRYVGISAKGSEPESPPSKQPNSSSQQRSGRSRRRRPQRRQGSAKPANSSPPEQPAKGEKPTSRRRRRRSKRRRTDR